MHKSVKRRERARARKRERQREREYAHLKEREYITSCVSMMCIIVWGVRVIFDFVCIYFLKNY